MSDGLKEKRIMIRTTEAFHEILTKIARDNKRSLNNQLLEALELYALTQLPQGTKLPAALPPKS